MASLSLAQRELVKHLARIAARQYRRELEKPVTAESPATTKSHQLERKRQVGQ